MRRCPGEARPGPAARARARARALRSSPAADGFARGRRGPRPASLRSDSVPSSRAGSPRARGFLRPELVQEWPRVEGVEAQASGDLLAGWARPLAEQRPQPLAGLGAAPPVLAHIRDEPGPQLRRADPGAQVV